MNTTKILLTEKQKKLLVYMAEFRHANKRPPTMQEMADYMGVTIPAIYQKLESLNRKKIIWKK